MIKQFSKIFKDKVDIQNISNIKISGGCLGCIHCGYEKECIYEGKDEYINFYNEKVKKADIIIYAGTIQDRYLSAKWKTFFDRRFFETHTPILKGKQIGFMVSGQYSQLPHLKEIFELESQLVEANLIGVITDESNNSKEIDDLLYSLAKKSIIYFDNKNKKPINFLQQSVLNVSLKHMSEDLKYPFYADYKYYVQKGYYKQNKKNWKQIMQNNFLIFISKFKRQKKEIQKVIPVKIVKPLDNLLYKI